MEKVVLADQILMAPVTPAALASNMTVMTMSMARGWGSRRLVPRVRFRQHNRRHLHHLPRGDAQRGLQILPWRRQTRRKKKPAAWQHLWQAIRKHWSSFRTSLLPQSGGVLCVLLKLIGGCPKFRWQRRTFARSVPVASSQSSRSSRSEPRSNGNVLWGALDLRVTKL